MFINIYIYSKNYHSIKKVLNLFSNKNLLKKLNLTSLNLSFYTQKKKKKKFTVLKSPHVNKTAQEHFNYTLYSKRIKVYSNQPFLFLILLKKLKNYTFSDVYFKIDLKNYNIKAKQKFKNQVNPDNFLLSSFNVNLNLYLKILVNYGKITLVQKTKFRLDSSVG